MSIKNGLTHYKSQIRLEKQIVRTAKRLAKNIDNLIIREMILGISMDSMKHESLLNTLIALHEKIALIDVDVTEELKEYLEKHIQLEKRAIETYKHLLDNIEDEKEKIIISFILEDEKRHHKFLKELQTGLIEKITFTDEDYWNWAWKDTEWGGGS